MASRDLQALHPYVLRRVEVWIAACVRNGIDLLITCTHRSLEEQTALYRTNRPFVLIEKGYFQLMRWKLEEAAEVLMRGPRQPGRQGAKKTHALPGLSFHNSHTYESLRGAFAVDFAVLKHGKPDWQDLPAYKSAGMLAEEHGLTWSGRWRKFRESCHIQWDKNGQIKILSLAQGKYA